MKPRTVVIPAQFAPSLDKALDKLLLDAARDEIPEWGLAPCRPGEVLEITIRRVVPESNPLTQKATVA